MAVTEYILVEAPSNDELAAVIAVKIAAAYQPYGFPFMRTLRDDPSETRMVQPMIKGVPTLNQTQDVDAFDTRVDDLETATANTVSAAPVAVAPTTGGTVTVTPVGSLTVELIQPAGTLAALTLTLAGR